jgi:hypothetical protein
MLYTVGMALSRAADNGCLVSVLIEGCWIHGQVAANDGTGVVIECSDGQHCVLKVERIAAVTVQSESPYKGSIPAVPMPGRRPSYV